MHTSCAVGVDGMDWGQAGEERKQLPPFVLYLVPGNMAGVGERSIVLWIRVSSRGSALVKERNCRSSEPITRHLGRAGMK